MCYGKVEGSSTLKDLPNRVNGELYGRIWLESKGNKIEIEEELTLVFLMLRLMDLNMMLQVK